VEWLPFDLHPEYPPEGIPRSDLVARYGPESQERVRRMVEECGYVYAPPPDRVPNSRKALEVTELARDRGLHAAVHTRLMDAYWSEGADIGDEPSLRAALDGFVALGAIPMAEPALAANPATFGVTASLIPAVTLTSGESNAIAMRSPSCSRTQG